MIRPTGSKVIVKPDVAPGISESGLIVPENARRDPAMSGIVVAVGNGPASAHRVRAATIAACRDRIETAAQDAEDDYGMGAALAALPDASEAGSFSEVSPGDRVCFAYTAGQHLVVDDEQYLVMQEDDIVAVLDDEVTG